MKKPYFASEVVICEECTCLEDVLNMSTFLTFLDLLKLKCMADSSACIKDG